MNLHSLKNTPGAKKRRMRVGRGESSGKGRTSGRGNKGQMSRTGHKRKPLFEGGQMKLIRRIPKRGFKRPNRVVYAALNIGDLIQILPGDITPETLVAAGRIGPRSLVKILGGGEVTAARTVKAHAFSTTARAKIEQAGGTCETIARTT
ncbi:MAG: 50S ribosomal protein L15 [Kiritimatiellae bacterium]|jgi:large subunit ribosomal protein L15|nr:50S ribosomal protein L15 [Kiritimatiellia bacterium]NLD90787.1 50S ribosomal protein L15 [Lentisphaerota bacterium]HQQ60745.1 50S ribosomal protein L15 [Kiritimatiellia bacterium]